MRISIIIFCAFLSINIHGQLEIFNAYWNFNETSGDVNDAIGTNDGVVTGATYNQAGKLGTCLGYDGSDYITLPDDSELQAYGVDFGMAAWIKATQLTGDENRKIFGGEVGAYYMEAAYSGGAYYLTFGRLGAGEAISDLEIELNTWYFVMAMADFSESTNDIYFYLNGARDTATLNQQALENSSTMYIGCYDPGYDHWIGYIDDAMIYKTLPTPAQQDSLYNSGSGCVYDFTTCWTAGEETEESLFINSLTASTFIGGTLAHHFILPYVAPVSPPSSSVVGNYDSTYVLALTQRFAIPENVSNGDYVGYWKKSFVWDYWWDDTRTYSIYSQPAGNPFAISSSTGLITISNSSLINGTIYQQDTAINIIVRTTSSFGTSELDTAEIWIKENAYCKFIDPSYGSGGSGIRLSPYDSWDDITFTLGYGYFIKRDEVVTEAMDLSLQNVYSTETNPTVISSYDAGAKPVMDGTNSLGGFLTIGNTDDPPNDSSTWTMIYGIRMINFASSVIYHCAGSQGLGIYGCDFLGNATDGTNIPVLRIMDQTLADSLVDYNVELINDSLQNPDAGFNLKSSVSGLTIRNCYFGSVLTGDNANLFLAGRENYIEHNVLNSLDATRKGITFQGRSSEITNNIILGCSFGIHFVSQSPGGQDRKVDSVFISNNYVVSNGTAEISGWACISFDSDISGYREQNMFAWNNILSTTATKPCIYLDRVATSKIYNNRFIVGGGDGIFANVTSRTDADYYDDTISYNIIEALTGTEISADLGDDWYICNNLVKGEIDISSANSSYVYNNFYITLTGTPTASANNADLDTVTTTIFYDYSGGDYRLNTGSWPIDAGTDWGQQADFYNNPQSGAAWDVGIHEKQQNIWWIILLFSSFIKLRKDR